ncbi:hypothetical protein ACFWR9_42275, partial [Streptomyces sp. NPDC058534]|uniref:hypothetical protein n=1 Tax=Streptomyces sp. NPDC058534 TaxID=3346541 RepID=UPI003666EF2B
GAAVIFAEALETLWLLIIAGGIWFVLGAVAVGLVLAALVLALYATLRTAWRLARTARIYRTWRAS